MRWMCKVIFDMSFFEGWAIPVNMGMKGEEGARNGVRNVFKQSRAVGPTKYVVMSK